MNWYSPSAFSFRSFYTLAPCFSWSFLSTPLVLLATHLKVRYEMGCKTFLISSYSSSATAAHPITSWLLLVSADNSCPTISSHPLWHCHHWQWDEEIIFSIEVLQAAPLARGAAFLLLQPLAMAFWPPAHSLPLSVNWNCVQDQGGCCPTRIARPCIS